MPLLAQRPEVLPVVASCVAWLVLVLGGVHAQGTDHAGHALSAMLMAVAAMAPFSLPLVRLVATGTPWWLAGRAAGGAFATFAATWAVMALALHGVAEAIGLVAPATAVAALLTGLCAVGSFRQSRSDRLLRCVPTWIPSRRRSPVHDGARRGLLAGLRCGELCLASMLAMLLVPQRLGVMAALCAVGLAERAWTPRRRVYVAAAYAAIGAAILVPYVH